VFTYWIMRHAAASLINSEY